MIEGMKELDAKIQKLKAQTSPKEIRKAGNKALTPALRAIRAAAPVGSKVHKTYKGRFVMPGFLRRSIGKSSRISGSGVEIKIRVRGEAFYGQFLEKGIRGIPARRWFFRTWAGKKVEALSRFESLMRQSIQKAIR